jgi:hypothetical protein
MANLTGFGMTYVIEMAAKNLLGLCAALKLT